STRSAAFWLVADLASRGTSGPGFLLRRSKKRWRASRLVQRVPPTWIVSRRTPRRPRWAQRWSVATWAGLPARLLGRRRAAWRRGRGVSPPKSIAIGHARRMRLPERNRSARAESQREPGERAIIPHRAAANETPRIGYPSYFPPEKRAR